MRDLPTGIFRTPTGYRVFQWVPDPRSVTGRVRSKRFKADASIKAMIEWREERRAEARKDPPPPTIAAGTFADDALTYLEAVRAMPSYTDRVRDIGEWIALFGEQPRSAITSTAIRTARDQWLTRGPRRVLQKVNGAKATWILEARPLAASTVNHRLRALENLFTVLDGKLARNPVRDVPEAIEPDPQPRGHSFALALEILSFMPDITTPKKKGAVEKGSLSRVRFEAMLWTGLPAVQLSRLTPEMVDWSAPAIRVPRRQKGKQSRRARRRVDRPRPLLPQAVKALRRFFALGANRKFSSTSLGRSVWRAIKAANRARAEKHLPLIPESLTVCQLTRHTFGTEALRASKNLKAVQELMGHRDISQTEHYARAAVDENTILAIKELSRATRRGRRGDRAGKPVVAAHPPQQAQRHRNRASQS